MPIKLLLLLTTFLCMAGCTSETNQNSKDVKISNTYAVEPQFSNGEGFSEGLAAIEVGGRIIEGGYSAGGKWGFIDEKGKFVINPEFYSVSPFSEGFAVVWRDLQIQQKGFIDRNGSFAIPPQFSDVQSFKEGLAPAQVEKKGLWGYINKKGEFVIESQFSDAGEFSEGYAQVVTSDGKYKFIDKSGKEVITLNHTFYKTYPFSEGLALVQVDDKDGKWGAINTLGDIVIEPNYGFGQFGPYDYGKLFVKYKEKAGFSEGLAAIENYSDNSKFGYIDKSGNLVIPHQFDYAGPFRDGLALIRIGDSSGFINRSGSFVINPQFDQAGDFSEGFAPICIKKQCGYIDKSGKVVVSLRFEEAYSFKDGYALIKQDNKYGYIRITKSSDGS